MKTRFQKPLIFLLSAFPLLLISDCAGMFEPPAPLWEATLYDTVAVLPVRMTVATGREPFTTEDTELSDNMSGKMQQALSVVMRYKNYEVLAPDDLSERLMEEEDLSEAFYDLASSQGLMGPDQKAPQAAGMEGAALIADKLGADLLIVARGNGEYHSVGENIVQTVLTGILSDGREQYQAPPSFLEVDINFIDPEAGARIARIPGRRMGYESKIVPLSRMLDRVLRRVPEKPDAEHGTQDIGDMPKP